MEWTPIEGALFMLNAQPGSITLRMALEAMQQTVNGKSLPYFTFRSFDLSFDQSKVQISLSGGGSMGYVLNSIIGWVSPLILIAVQTSLNLLLPMDLQYQINEYFKNQQGFMNLESENKYFLDYSFMQLPKVTSNQVEVYVDGNIVTEKDSDRRPRESVKSDLKMLTAGSGAIKAAVGASTLNSLLLALYERKALDTHARQDEQLTEELKFMLSTTFLDNIIPELCEVFDYDEPISVELTHTEAPQAKLINNEISLQGSLQVQIKATADYVPAVTLLFPNVTASVSITFDKETMTIQPTFNKA